MSDSDQYEPGGRGNPDTTTTISFRMPRDEADAIRDAASHASQTPSEWIRIAARSAVERRPVRRYLPSEVETALRRVREIADDVLAGLYQPPAEESEYESPPSSEYDDELNTAEAEVLDEAKPSRRKPK